MKKFIFILLLLFLLGSSIINAELSTTDPDLIAVWTFDEDMNESITNTASTTSDNAFVFADDICANGKCHIADGQSQDHAVGTEARLNWSEFDDATLKQKLLGSYEDFSICFYSYIREDNPWNSNTYQFYSYDNWVAGDRYFSVKTNENAEINYSLKISVGADDGCNANSVADFVSTKYMYNYNVKYHTCAVFDGSSEKMLFYQDGINYENITNTASLGRMPNNCWTSSSTPIHLTGYSNTYSGAGETDATINGSIDELYIWNRTLSQDEVASLADGAVYVNGFGFRFSNWNMTSDGGCEVWEDSINNSCNTTDSTPTITVDTSIDVECRIGKTDSNWRTMGVTRNCTTTGSTSHICTLIAGDALSSGNQFIYVSCNESESAISYSGGLNITYTDSPTVPTNLTCDDGSCNNTFSSSISINCSGSTDINDDTITYSIEKGNITTDEFCDGTADVCSAHITNETCQYDAGCDWNGTALVVAEIDYEPFDSDVGGWTQATGDDYNWEWQNIAPTDSGSTGPNELYDGGYMFIETSSNKCNDPDEAVLYLSPAINFTEYAEINVSFAYNMIGATMGTLHIKENSTGVWVSVWSKSGDQGISWLTANQNITSSGEGNVAIWMYCGASYTSDAAIDSVNVSGTTGGNTCVGTPAGCSTYDSNQTTCDGTGCDWNPEVLTYTYIGNHTENLTYTWDISGEEDGEIYERMRCRAIDLDGSNEYSGNYTLDTILNISSTGADSCSCPGLTTNWEIDMTDMCQITTDCNISTGILNFTGASGWANLSARVDCNENMGVPSSDTTLWMYGVNAFIYLAGGR